MSFDPTIPQANTDLDALPIRNEFNALKTLIDALPASPPPTRNGSPARRCSNRTTSGAEVL